MGRLEVIRSSEINLVPPVEGTITRHRRLLELARQAQTPGEIRAVFAQIGPARFILRHRDLFISIAKIAREAGFRFRNDQLYFFLNELRWEKEPFLNTLHQISHDGWTVVRIYHSVLIQQQTDVVAIFYQAESLERFRTA